MRENMVTDRTLNDIQRWQYLRDKGYDAMTDAERAEWRAGLKGAYNITDLNRVNNALEYLRNRLVEAGYLVGIEFIPKTDWDGLDVPTTADLTAYLNAVKVVREAITQKVSTPPVPPDNGGLDYQGANNIEQILIDIDDIIDKMQSMPVYCGELYAGEI